MRQNLFWFLSSSRMLQILLMATKEEHRLLLEALESRYMTDPKHLLTELHL
jgi:hypothetical protein